MHPQQFEERVAEEEAPVGGSLTGMDVACAFREPELAKQFGFGSAHIHADEEMVKFKHRKRYTGLRVLVGGKTKAPLRHEDNHSMGGPRYGFSSLT